MAKENSSLGVILIRAAVILATGLLIYWPVMDGDWLWDDAIYFTANPLLHDPHRLWKAWFVPGSFLEYYPITETVQWWQWKLWGDATTGYHLTNIFLHCLNALLVWMLLGKFNLRWAWVGGLIFVLHPMNVESVAYISELKNTLSLPPFLLALCCYINFEQSRRPRDYLLALALFLLAMLCKVTFMTFPFVILLYAWWKRGRIGLLDFRHAVPFLAISLILGETTLWAGLRFEQLYPLHPAALPSGSFLSHLALAGWVISVYFSHFFWPLETIPMYPRWSIQSPSLLSFFPYVLWAGGVALLWWKRKSWGRNFLLGLGFFVILLLPFSGLVMISYMNFSWVMDHFLYAPMIGLIGLVVAGLERIDAEIPSYLRRTYAAAVGVILLLLAGRSQDYAAVWTDRMSLWTYALLHNPQAWLAHYNLANELRERGQYDVAIDQYREAIKLNPVYDWAHNNLGMALSNFPEHLNDAVAEYREAVRLRPSSAEAHNNLANALLQLPGNVPEAIAEYRTAIQIKPDFTEAQYNLGLALARQPGGVAEARAQFQEILKAHPNFEPAQDMLDKLPAGP